MTLEGHTSLEERCPHQHGKLAIHTTSRARGPYDKGFMPLRTASQRPLTEDTVVSDRAVQPRLARDGV